MKFNQIKYAAAIATMAALTAGSQAALTTVVQFNSGDAAPSPIIAVSTDLLQTSLSSTSGLVTSQNLLNGTTGTASENTVGNPASAAYSATTFFNLDITVNTLGYDITDIRLFSGWNDGRVNQKYTIYYQYVTDPVPAQQGWYYALSSVDTAATYSDGSLLSRTYDNTGAPLLTGVKSLAIDFFKPAGTETVYREIDVLGTPTAAIPEPSAALLGGLGMLCLLRRRK
jgi:hypothetical protein